MNPKTLSTMTVAELRQQAEEALAAVENLGTMRSERELLLLLAGLATVQSALLAAILRVLEDKP